MKKLSFSYEMSTSYSRSVMDNYFTLKCTPSENNKQSIYNYELKVDRASSLQCKHDMFGNVYYTGRIIGTHHRFRCTAEGVVWVKNTPVKEPIHPLFQYETEMTKLTLPMKEWMYEISTSQTPDSWLGDVLMDAVYQYFTYTPNLTNIYTTAGEAFALQCGVCQDYAHLLIALCREKGMPARYVAGGMIGEGVSHAWVEVGTDHGWIGLDPTHNRRVDDTYLTFSVGRDANDCSVNRGVFTGVAEQTQWINMDIQELD